MRTNVGIFVDWNQMEQEARHGVTSRAGAYRGVPRRVAVADRSVLRSGPRVARLKAWAIWLFTDGLIIAAWCGLFLGALIGGML
jgi:hypothetical protein